MVTVGVFALLAGLIVDLAGDDPNNIITTLKPLLYYAITVLIGLSFMVLVFYPLIIYLVTGVNFKSFFKAIFPAQMLAFSTSSSAATLPVTMKRVEKNLELVEKFISIGVPRKQIIISGHSCGGLLTLMLLSSHPEKVGGGISYMQACYGKLSKQYKVKKVGSEEALAKFAKKYPGGAELRQRQIDNIKKSNDVPVLAFTHPKDKFEGLLSDWLEEVPGVKRIVISEDYKINGKTCVIKGNDWEEKVSERKNAGHVMNQGLCFQYYNPVILDYIASRIK